MQNWKLKVEEPFPGGLTLELVPAEQPRIKIKVVSIQPGNVQLRVDDSTVNLAPGDTLTLSGPTYYA